MCKSPEELLKKVQEIRDIYRVFNMKEHFSIIEDIVKDTNCQSFNLYENIDSILMNSYTQDYSGRDICEVVRVEEEINVYLLGIIANILMGKHSMYFDAKRACSENREYFINNLFKPVAERYEEKGWIVSIEDADVVCPYSKKFIYCNIVMKFKMK